MYKRIILFLFVSVNLCEISLAEPVFTVSPQMDGIPLGRYIRIFEEQGDDLQIADIVSGSHDGEFYALEVDYFNFGYKEHPLWFRLDVENRSVEDIEWYFEAAYTLIDEIEIYSRSEGEWVKTALTGAKLEFKTRQYDYNYFAFPMEAKGETASTYYIKVSTPTVAILPFKAWSAAGLSADIEKRYLLLGVYFGILFIMMAYNYLLSISIRDVNYLYYVAYLFFMSMTQLSYHGLAFQFFWPESPYWNYNSIFIFSYLSYISGVQFSRSFLNTSEVLPRIDLVLKALMILAALLCISVFFLDLMTTGMLLNSMFSLLFILVIAGAASWLNGYRPARFYVIAWSIFLVGVVILGLRNLGAIGESPLAAWGYMAGSALEVVLLSLALGDRINLIRDEREKVKIALEESETKFLKTTDNIPGVVFQFKVAEDGSYRIPYVSSSSTTLSGYRPEQFEKDPETFFSNIHDDDKERILASIQRAVDTFGGWDAEFRFNRASGDAVWFHGKSTPQLLSTGAKLWNGVMFDITEKKMAEKELAEKKQQLLDTLEKSKLELEIKVDERTSELRKAKKVAEDATRLKDDFVSLVSHDLRSPLSGMLGLLRVLEMKDKGFGGNGEKEEIMKRSQNLVSGMLKMIDDLMDITRLQTGKITLEKRFLDLKAIVSLTYEKLSFNAETKGIILKDDVPAEHKIYADLTLLQTVFHNLVTNAIKFGNKGTTVSIYCPDGNSGNAAVPFYRIVVADTGIGIEKERLAILFKHEAKKSTVGTGGERGTGLGLPFCNDIIKAHGGSLTVESEIGRGTSFDISLPLVKHVVLLVDDQAVQRKITGEIIRKLPFVDVIEAENGKKGLEKACGFAPKCIITDLNMPEMDGFKFIEELNKRGHTRDLPVIVCSSLATVTADNLSIENADLKEKLMKAGAVAVFQKPLLEEEFLPELKKNLGI